MNYDDYVDVEVRAINAAAEAEEQDRAEREGETYSAAEAAYWSN